MIAGGSLIDANTPSSSPACCNAGGRGGELMIIMMIIDHVGNDDSDIDVEQGLKKGERKLVAGLCLHCFNEWIYPFNLARSKFRSI